MAFRWELRRCNSRCAIRASLRPSAASASPTASLRPSSGPGGRSRTWSGMSSRRSPTRWRTRRRGWSRGASHSSVGVFAEDFLDLGIDLVERIGLGEELDAAIVGDVLADVLLGIAGNEDYFEAGN